MSTTFTYVQPQELNGTKSPIALHRHALAAKELRTVPNTPRHEEKVVEMPHARQPVETKQKVLLLRGIREQYALVNDHDIPSVSHPEEILVKAGINLGILYKDDVF